MLVHLRYAEIAIMLRMSARIGKRGCVKTFLAAVCFSLTLWATTHARDYCRLACDLLIFWKCASPAMKELYAREMFTRIDATLGIPCLQTIIWRNLSVIREAGRGRSTAADLRKVWNILQWQ